MQDFPIHPHFTQFSTENLKPEQTELLAMLPADFVAFLQRYNGGRVDAHTINFYTGIPFEEPNPLAPSKADFVIDFLGLSNEEDSDWEDIWGYNFGEGLNVFPEGIVVVARCNYGLVGLEVAESGRGTVWYHWTHYPSVAYHFEAKRAAAIAAFPQHGTPEAIKADQFALLEKLADSWTEFLNSFAVDHPLQNDYPEITFFTYEIQYEQVRRLCAYHNIMYMAGKVPSPEQEIILKEVDSGFLPSHSIAQIREEAPNSHSMYVLENPIADSWILDRMLDALMVDSQIHDWQYHLVVEFARQAGYPKMEVDNCISDYHARKHRQQNRQAPPMDVIFQDGRENALAIIQNLYLIGIASGPITPAQDQQFAKLAHANDLDAEELKHIVRHKLGLDLVLPKFKGWWPDLRKEVAEYLQLEGTPQPASLAIAERLYSMMGLTPEDLQQDMKAPS